MKIGSGGVATVTMVRADKHNALDQAMFEALQEAALALAADTSVRAVVLHGEGKSFCSGLDVASFMGYRGGTKVLLTRADDHPANFAQRVTYDWSMVPAPVIAAIHGNCFGGGLQIALGADIRIAAPDAKLSIMEIKWGLVPDMGITQTLPRLLPIDVAKELAAEIASRSPDAMRAAKRLYDTSWHAPVEEGLLLETELQTGLIGSPNQIEAVRAGMAKEPANFA